MDHQHPMLGNDLPAHLSCESMPGHGQEDRLRAATLAWDAGLRDEASAEVISLYLTKGALKPRAQVHLHGGKVTAACGGCRGLQKDEVCAQQPQPHSGAEEQL